MYDYILGIQFKVCYILYSRYEHTFMLWNKLYAFHGERLYTSYVSWLGFTFERWGVLHYHYDDTIKWLDGSSTKRPLR